MDIDKALQASNNAPFYVFNLFADYFELYGDGTAMTQDILHLLGLLGLSEQAARSTLLRMKRKGWLDAERVGRQTRYKLSPSGHTITQQGDKRIFETPIDDWNGEWQFVVYSLPEEKRSLRNELRKKLVWFGFGNLAPGTWVGAHDRLVELKKIVDDMEIRSQVSLMSGRRVGLMTDAEIVAKCWDLDRLEAEYADFVSRWRAQLEGIDIVRMSAEERFRVRFMLTFEFQPFPRKDPNLPTALLPPNWSGFEARHLFTTYRKKLNEGLPIFFDKLSISN